ncbi:MAG: type IV secretory system conjugative DNA transfer family protein, partial [Acutalibacteraceae bacterium]|nr:type IV secretory system conjugative DNA transfer family protein [Acutalibacteraceae bacterium]
MNTEKLKKNIILAIPPIMFFWVGNKFSYAYRIADGNDISQKMLPFFNNLADVITNPLPSFNLIDITIGILIAVIIKFALDYKKKHAKKYRDGEEYGDARWGNEKDIQPYMDTKSFENNVLLTQTE